MPISYNEELKQFKLDSKGSSYIIGIYKEGYLLNLYYGDRVEGDADFTSLGDRTPYLCFSPSNPVIGGYFFSPDTAPLEYASNGNGDFRAPAITVKNSGGDCVTDLRYKSHTIYSGKPKLPGLPATYAKEDEATTLELVTEDSLTGCKVTLLYTVFENHSVITRSVKVENCSENTLEIERALSCCVDLPRMDFDLISLYGRHNSERNVNRRPLGHGVQGVESKRGVTGHASNPFVALAEQTATEESGEVYGFNLVYSGNFTALVECDYNETSRVVMGINPQDFQWTLNPQESFYTPEVVMVYSPSGLGEMSRTYHRFYNNHLIRGKYKTEKRPLPINSWEAAYFDFDSDKLVEFAEAASKVGIEMLVMDDGWFGKRDDDTNSLGDWFVNEKKLEGGLKPLIKRVNNLGLKFGIWYEPEMISPDSNLYREHPDWCVHVKGREPMISRQQYVLDVSREDVRENIWNQLYSVLSTNKIDYVKWDFNRNVSDASSALLPPERKKEFFHRFILGTYELMDKLVSTFPDLLFENCSGGGGRFDPAMLYYSPQIWTSDNTDALDRIKIQFGTSLCYPASCQSSHVSANPRTSYKTKGDVALWGTFGYEMDPRNLSEEDLATIKQQVEDYHKYYWLVRNGDLYRLRSPYHDPHLAAWEIVSEDKSEALLTVVSILAKQSPRLLIKLRGLDPNKEYTETTSGKVYTGDFLMKAGLNLQGEYNGDGKSTVLHFKEK